MILLYLFCALLAVAGYVVVGLSLYAIFVGANPNDGNALLLWLYILGWPILFGLFILVVVFFGIPAAIANYIKNRRNQ